MVKYMCVIAQGSYLEVVILIVYVLSIYIFYGGCSAWVLISMGDNYTWEIDDWKQGEVCTWDILGVSTCTIYTEVCVYYATILLEN